MQNVEVIKTSHFQKTIIRLYFPLEDKPEECLFSDALGTLIVQHTKKYPKIDELNKFLINNYIYNVRYSCNSYGKQKFIFFTMYIPDEKSLGEDILENSCKILFDMVYDPKVSNEEFDKNDLKLTLDTLKTKDRNIKKDIMSYSSSRVDEELDPDFFGYSSFNHPELYNQVTPKTMYEFYNKHIGTKTPYIFVIGDVDSKKVNKIFEKLLVNKPYSPYDNTTEYYLTASDEVKKIEETGPYNQSALHLVYKVSNMAKSDEILLYLVNSLLNSSASNLLYKNVRDDKGLVYQIFSKCAYRFGILSIVAMINASNKEKTLSAITEVIESLKDITVVKENLDNFLKLVKNDLEWDKDSIFQALGDKVETFFGLDVTNEEFYHECLKIEPKEIVEFISRLKLDMVYFLKGDKHE